MKKLLLTFVLFLSGISAYAIPASIDSAIENSNINKNVVAVSVKNTATGKTLYEHNQKNPISPASTLKVITATIAADTLGKDYQFKTSFLKNNNNELFLKLSADPYLTRGDLSTLMKAAVAKKIIEPKRIYIDDYVMDGVEWGEGWQWDDDLNPLMPKFSPYNLDSNLLTAIIDPKVKGAPASIKLNTFYPVTFMNFTVSGGEINSVKFERNNHISPDMITVSGSVTGRTQKRFPVNSPKRYFIIKLEEAVSEAKLEYYGDFPQKKLPSSGLTLISEINHPIKSVLTGIYKYSNNMMAETLFKVAGGKYVSNTGAVKNALKMVEAYCQKNGLKYENIKIVDGSGVSKNNLMTADFMTDFLLIQAKREDFDEYMTMLPTAGEGTLQDRMLYFKDVIYAKTGTLSDISSICGYIKTRNGSIVAFDIMINDPKSSSSDKKAAEEQIIRAIYNKY